jgi:hypothetical protein
MGIILVLLLFVGIFGIGIGGSVLWVWMLVDCAMNEPAEGSDKIVWILVILFTHFLGALIYLLSRRPERRRLYGK